MAHISRVFMRGWNIALAVGILILYYFCTWFFGDGDYEGFAQKSIRKIAAVFRVLYHAILWPIAWFAYGIVLGWQAVSLLGVPSKKS